MKMQKKTRAPLSISCISPPESTQCLHMVGANQKSNTWWWDGVAGRDSLNPQELHVEDEGGVARDDGSVPLTPVGVIGRAGQLGPLPHAHLLNAFIPAPDHIPFPNLKRERLVSFPGGVERFSVCQASNIMHHALLSWFGKSFSVSRMNRLNLDSHFVL
uniref:Uncharacterized protein n=1 Tax=Anguilla anguilla TaxID=7936 RepID=A0A0E9X939_ANGAN